jgi:molybdopterin converting factor subunit 1
VNRIKVLFFATLRERAGTRGLELEIGPGTTISQLKAQLLGQLPGLGSQGTFLHCLAAINHEYSADDGVIPEHAEVAFFPPVSGG